MRRDPTPCDRACASSAGLGLDTAQPWFGLQNRLERVTPETVQNAADQGEVHRAHQLGVLLGQPVEGAVRQAYGLVVAAGLVTVPGERLGSTVEVGTGSEILDARRHHSSADLRNLHDGLSDWDVVAAGALDRLRQDLSGQVVVTFGQ